MMIISDVNAGTQCSTRSRQRATGIVPDVEYLAVESPSLYV